MTHVEGPSCPGCSAKLEQAHPFLKDWFNNHVKPQHLEAHVSWSYRGKEDQEKAFNEGKSRLHFPESAHNFTENEKPKSYALDLFEIIQNRALFDPAFYRKINAENVAGGIPVFWGGTFRSFQDLDHFAITEDALRKTYANGPCADNSA